jgi:hypothetical protein
VAGAVTEACVADVWLFRRMYWWYADVRREFVPLLYQQFDATPSARLPSSA